MTTRIMTAALVALGAALAPAEAGVFREAQAGAEVVRGEYIVQVKARALSRARGAGRSAESFAGDLAGIYGGVVTHRYDRVLPGFAARLSEPQARALARDPDVEAVFPVIRMFLAATQSNAPWHLDRIDQRDLPLNTLYDFEPTGAGVHAWVIDTGLRATHQQFTGRVGSGFDAVGDGNGTNDCGGHGTFVSGIIGATTWGVAKGVTLHAGRVFGCDGGTTNTRVISALNHVVQSGGRPAVVNMSLKGGPDPATDQAIRNATGAGVVVVVAAGNGNTDACNGSPAREPAAITVGASTPTDSRASFSDFGTCVDLFAPGQGLTSTSFSSDTATTTGSGTSASSPVVAGVVALFLQQNPGASAAAVQEAVKDNATLGRLSGIGAGSPNRLAYSIFEAPPSGGNLALGKPATGSTPCNANEGPEKAVNGSVSGGTSDKWCSLAATKLLQVDLGGSFSVERFVVKHAGAGGESTTWNTRDFNLQVSADGTSFTTVASMTGSTASTTTHTFAARTARFVRLDVLAAQQNGGGAARIYELEVYGSAAGSVFSDDFETALGWTANPAGTDTATTGLWQRGNPQGTSSGGSAMQLEDAASGGSALVTGLSAGSSVGSNDVDGGATSIQSPAIALPSSGTITLSFRYYLAHLGNATSADFFRVRILGSGGALTTVFEELGSATVDPASWATGSADLSAFAGQTVHVRVEAADAASASLVEAGLDQVTIRAE